MNFDPRLGEIAATQPFPLVFASVSGAHLYGFESSDSDWDLRGVHVLPVSEVVGLDTGPETVSVSEDRDGLDLDLVTHDVHKFCRLLLNRNGYVLEQLYSPLVVKGGARHSELRHIATGCITRNHAHHYRGFSQTEWRLFEKSDRTALKPLLYVFRVLKTGIHLMRTGRVEPNLGRMLDEDPVIPFIGDLIADKRARGEHASVNDLPITAIESAVASLRESLDNASERSHLPEKPSARAALHDFVLRCRLEG